jgi:hypothetical protein
MRPLKSLTLEARIGWLSERFSQIPDERASDRINDPLRDRLMSGFALMFFQHPSWLLFQRALKQQRRRCNLETIFGVQDVPSDRQMREILDGVPVEPLRRWLPKLFERVRRAGWAESFKTHLPTGAHQGAYYRLVLAGSEYFHSTQIHCPGCLRQVDARGREPYSHTVVSARLVKAGSPRVLPLDLEEVRNGDGARVQDCQLTYDERAFGLLFLKAGSTYHDLRSDPRFAELVRRVGLAP